MVTTGSKNPSHDLCRRRLQSESEPSRQVSSSSPLLLLVYANQSRAYAPIPVVRSRTRFHKHRTIISKLAHLHTHTLKSQEHKIYSGSIKLDLHPLSTTSFLCIRC
ncbi:hypothetical protein Hanom_Chr10g00961741 [Helianthus anomalus]